MPHSNGHLRLAPSEERWGLTNTKNWRQLLLGYVGNLFPRIAFVIRTEKSPMRRGTGNLPRVRIYRVTQRRVVGIGHAEGSLWKNRTKHCCRWSFSSSARYGRRGSPSIKL